MIFLIISAAFANSLMHNWKATCLLKIDNQYSCTAFAINETQIMTAWHCLDKRPKEMNCDFEYEQLNPVKCKINRKLKMRDQVILDCTGEREHWVTPGRKVTELHYMIDQNCDYISDPFCKPWKRYQFGKKLNDQVLFKHNFKTFPGSSGAPIFNENHECVGVHVARGYGEKL